MDARSETILRDVHPDLAKVIRLAPQLPQGFLVIQGLRTPEQEAINCAKGASQTMHSRHLPNRDGLACAVDVAALNDGQVSFAAGHEEAVFGEIAAQVLKTAEALNIPLQWGGAPVGAWTPGVVSHFRDWGHFQLPWAQYPA